MTPIENFLMIGFMIICLIVLAILIYHIKYVLNSEKQIKLFVKELNEKREVEYKLTEQLEKWKTDYSILFERNCTRVREVADLTSDNQKLNSYIELLKTDLKSAAKFLKEFNEINLSSQSN